MKVFLLIVTALMVFASSIAFSGAVQPAPVEIVNFVDANTGLTSGLALGDMLTARDDDNRDYGDDVLIGCGIKGFDNGDGTAYQFIFCQASGTELDPGTFEPLDSDTAAEARCFSDNRDLVDIFKAVDSYSFLRFNFRQPTQDEIDNGSFGNSDICTRVDVSTQSFYLPKTKANKAPND